MSDFHTILLVGDHHVNKEVTAHSGKPAVPGPPTAHTACDMYELTIVTTGPARGGSHTTQQEFEALPSHTWTQILIRGWPKVTERCCGTDTAQNSQKTLGYKIGKEGEA